MMSDFDISMFLNKLTQTIRAAIASYKHTTYY